MNTLTPDHELLVTDREAPVTAEDTPAGSHWRLLMTRPRQEPRVIANLQRLGLPYRAPEWVCERFIRGRRLTRTEWLFPRYVFVRVDFTQTPFNYLKYLAGVSGFVRCAQRLVEVSESLIASLDGAAEAAGQGRTTRPAIAPGAAVRLNGGAYQDVPAVFLEADGETRSRVLLSWLGRDVEAQIDNRYLCVA